MKSAVSVGASLLVGSLAASLVQAHWLWGCCPDVEPKQPKKCGEYLPFHHARNSWKTGAGEFPFLADLEIKMEGDGNLRANCSGAILSNQAILTSIKCVKDKYGKPIERGLQVFVGSSYQNKYGEQVEVAKIAELALGTGLDECLSSKVQHGLALLKLVEPIKFRFEKRNSTRPRPKYINSACFKNVNYSRIDQNHRFNSSQFLDSEVCAKVLEFELRICPASGSEDPPAKINCATLIEGPANLTHAVYQEGAPLVDLTEDNRWQVLGVLSKDMDLWGNCEPHDGNNPKLTKFIPTYNEVVKKWLEKFVLNTP